MWAVYIWQCCAVMYYLAALQGFFVFEMRCVAVVLLIAARSLSFYTGKTSGARVGARGAGGTSSFIHSHDRSCLCVSSRPPVLSAHLLKVLPPAPGGEGVGGGGEGAVGRVTCDTFTTL